MAERLVATDWFARRWRCLFFFWFMLPYLQISVEEFLILIVRKQILACQSRFEVREIGMGNKAMCKEDSCSWDSRNWQIMRKKDCMKRGNRMAVVFWRFQCFFGRIMWDKWPSPILLKDRKLHRIFPGKHIIRERAESFVLFDVWKDHFIVEKLYPASLATISPCLLEKV